LSEVAGFAARILGQSQEVNEPAPTKENDPERQKAIETLRNPSIYHELDYWGHDLGGNGHGIKIRLGTRPPELPSDRTFGPPSTRWFHVFKDEPVNLGSWHAGKGAIVKFASPGNTTTYVLHYQIKGSSSRPDVYSVTTVPNSAEFDELQSQLSTDATLLADAFASLYPEASETKLPEDIEFIKKAPFDLSASR